MSGARRQRRRHGRKKRRELRQTAHRMPIGRTRRLNARLAIDASLGDPLAQLVRADRPVLLLVRTDYFVHEGKMPNLPPRRKPATKELASRTSNGFPCQSEARTGFVPPFRACSDQHMPSPVPTEFEPLSRVRRLFSLLRLKAFESSTAEGLARERHRRIALATVASALSKGVGVLANLLIIPMTVRYLGSERYAIWAMLTTLFVTLNSFDFGIGTGLVNVIAAASGREDRQLIKRLVSSGFFMFLIIGSAMALLVLAVTVLWPFGVYQLFNVSTGIARHEARSSVAMVAVIFGFGMPFLVALRFQEGLQEGYKSYLTQACASLLGLALTVLVIKLKLGLPWLVLSLLGSQGLANAGMFVAQFFVSKRWARPSARDFDATTTRSLVKTGMLFFALNWLTLVGLQALDPFVISHVIAASDWAKQVTAYSVVQRLSQLAFLYWAFTQALWPAYAEAIARQDFDWVKRTIIRSIRLSLVWGCMAGVFLSLCGGWIIRIWVGTAVSPADCRGLLLSFGFFILVNSLVMAFATIINGSHFLKEQLVILGAAASLSFVLKIVLGKKFGAAGVVWGTNIAFLFAFVAPSAVLIYNRYWRSIPQPSLL